MQTCRTCGSLMVDGECSNRHCGKKFMYWAKTVPPLYRKDIQTCHDLIRAVRRSSEQAAEFGGYAKHRFIGQM
jgi:hypothetical protein